MPKIVQFRPPDAQYVATKPFLGHLLRTWRALLPFPNPQTISLGCPKIILPHQKILDGGRIHIYEWNPLNPFNRGPFRNVADYVQSVSKECAEWGWNHVQVHTLGVEHAVSRRALDTIPVLLLLDTCNITSLTPFMTALIRKGGLCPQSVVMLNTDERRNPLTAQRYAGRFFLSPQCLASVEYIARGQRRTRTLSFYTGDDVLAKTFFEEIDKKCA